MRQDKKRCKVCGKQISSYKSIRKLLCLEHDKEYQKWRYSHGNDERGTMKIYICLTCGEHGCKLEVDDYGGKPMVCPYKSPRGTFNWKEIVAEDTQELKDFFEDNKKNIRE